MLVPHDGRLALIGDTDRGDILHKIAQQLEPVTGLHHAQPHRFQYFHRILLEPTLLGNDLSDAELVRADLLELRDLEDLGRNREKNKIVYYWCFVKSVLNERVN